MTRTPTVLFWLFALAFSSMITSCGGGGGDEPDPTPQPSGSITISGNSEIIFQEEGGSKTIDFQTDLDWTATVANTGGTSWCHISPTSGSSGSSHITITVDPNASYDERNVIVTIKCGRSSKTVAVTQKQKNALLLTSSKIEIDNAGGNVTCEVKTNISYTVTIPAEFSEWISRNESRGLQTYTEVFKIAPNLDADKREGYIIFKGDNGMEEKVHIYQTGGENIVLSVSSITVGSEGDTFSVEIQKNCDFKIIMPDVDWLRQDLTRAISSQTLHFIVSPNESYDERNARIVFETAGGEKSEGLVVTQKQKDALLLTNSVVEMTNKGGTFTSEVMANIDYDVVIPTQYSSWISRQTTRGLKAYKETFRVEPNYDFEKREGYILFTGPDGIEEKLQVFQNPSTGLVLQSSSVTMESNGGEFSIEISRNCGFDVEMPDVKWLRRIDTRSMSTQTLHFEVDPYTGTDGRKAEIVFVSDDKSVKETFTVYQLPKGALIIGEKTIEAPAGKGTFGVSYSSNTSIKFEISGDAKNWIKPVSNGTRAMEEHEQWFSADANTTGAERRGEIVFSDAKGELSETVTVVQDYGHLSIVSSTLKPGDFKDAAAHEFEIQVSANVNYTVAVPSFVKMVSGPAGENSLLKFKVDENMSLNESHYGIIRLEWAGVTLEQFEVSQEVARIRYNDTDIFRVLKEGGVLSPVIDANIGVSATVGTSASGWISVLPPENGGFIPRLQIAANNTESEREGYVTFSCGSIWNKSITVIQKGIPPESLDVTVPEGESLSEIIEDSGAAMNIVSLDVNGTVSGNDVELLRKMAIEGKLEHLDLTDTRIKAGTESYDIVEGGYVIRTFKIEKDDTFGDYMFYKTNLKTLELPKTLKEIGECAFSLSAIEEITVPEGVVSMGEETFRGCGRLVKASLPGSLKKLPERCFEQTYNLERVTLGEGMEEIDNIAFWWNPGGSAMTSCLKEVVLPSTMKRLGNKAFGCSGLQSVVIPENLTEYGEIPFYSCQRLSKVIMKGVPKEGKLPDRMFSGCPIETLELPEGIKVIGQLALWAIKVDEPKIPSTVVELQYGALANCEATKLVLPEGLEIIGDQALGQMWRMTSLTLPSTVNKIGSKILYSTLLPLKTIHCKMKTPPIPSGPLVNENEFDYSACTLYVPKGSADLYRRAEYWKNFTKIKEE